MHSSSSPNATVSAVAMASARPWTRYAVALLIVLFAAGVRWAILPLDGGFPQLTFYPAVVAATILCGLGPGLAAVALSAVISTYVFVPPYLSWGYTWIELFTMFIYGSAATTIVLSIAWLQARLNRHNELLQAEVRHRQQAEDNLRDRFHQLSAQEEEFRAFFENNACGCAELNLDGTFARVNRRYCELVGYAEDELKNLPVSRLTHPDDLELHRRALEPFLAGKSSSLDIEKRYVTKAGEIRWVKVQASFIRDSVGQPVRTAAVVIDISDSKRIESEMQWAKAEADKANAEKSKFLAAISHDLRQPLSALALYIRGLEDKLLPRDLPLAASMESCVTSLTAMLTDALDLSRLSTGGVTPKREQFRVHDLLERVASTFRPEAKRKGLIFRVSGSRRYANTDPVLFQRLLGNLVSNAIRYTDRGGVLLGERRRDGKAWIEVWDTGIGIPEEKIPAIFQEYLRLDEDAGRRPGGSGIGLAVVAKLAEILGIQIRVASRVGKGSVFAIEIPECQVAPAANREDELNRGTVQPLRLLLIEDNPDVLKALSTALSEDGHLVFGARSLEQLTKPLDAVEPDAVIADLRLGRGRSGLDVIQEVRRRCGAGLPGILITADDGRQAAATSLRENVWLLRKPLNLDKLSQILGQIQCLRLEPVEQ